MVKMFAVLRRRPGMTVEEFRRHWHEVHGPLITSHPELARHIVRYEQHVRHAPGWLSGTEDIDGIAEQWFERIEDFEAFMNEPLYGELIAPDERRFIDMDRIEFIITDEPVVAIDGPRSGAEAG
jgi:uncharacterized protein (TIGR02118 family)